MDDEQQLEMMPKLIPFLSSLLQKVATSNDRSRRSDGDDGSDDEKTVVVSAFHGLKRPTIPIERYLERIFKYAKCSPSCYVVAYVYLDRFSRRRRQPHTDSFSINSFNVHRLLITSVLVAAKFLDDIFYNNAYYAKVGGIGTEEMNILEVEFLFGLGFRLNVAPFTFQAYYSSFQREMLSASPPLYVSLSPPSPNPSILLHCSSSISSSEDDDEEDDDDSTHHQQLIV